MGDAVVLSSSATRHSCKVCRKGFPCGRSLGGHMRSHSLAEVETAVEDDGDDNGEEQQQQRRGSDCLMVPGAGGYGLRENPKKTRRLSGLDGGDESGGRQEECGHGDRGELLSPCAPEVGHERRHAPGAGMEVEAEREQEDAIMLIPTEPAVGLMPAPRRRRRSMRVPAPAPPPAFDKEPEDVALCLIMLSRDILHRRDSTVTGAEYSPEKDRRRRDYHHDTDSDDASALFQYTDVEISTKTNKRKPNRSLAGDDKRGRYECPGCGRAFQSYQALGGHRASHKRINSNCSIAKVAPNQAELSVETNASFNTASPDADYATDIANNTAVVALKAKPQKAIKFECPICFKVFGSGQALGGHKRSHSIAGELYERAHADGDAGIDEPEQPMIADGFLDLNLPAPGAED
ncbi:zinc finger protein ZAT4-like [Panicum miliaceum]|uniref:Zinc finger protein ZAT4-like n=1 Tax=Panicum miliaceum TaxID=4540 RepID=A0A3L6TTF0_PANMI|nr:zinc finger protein ZAT4-like [Panicum miliaceum]